MKKKIAAMALSIYLTGVFGTAYASTDVTNQLISEAASTTQVTQDAGIVQPRQGVKVDIQVIENSAGILPNSIFYSIEREMEALQTAITKSQEKLAALKAKYATERAAEAAIMVNQGEEALAGDAAKEYMELLDSATEHINNAIEVKNDAAESLKTLNEAYQKSEDILKSILEKAPEDARVTIETALNEQDEAISVVNGFYAAKKAFFAAKEQLKLARQELKAAKRSGDAAAIRAAEEKVRAAEALKNELEALKDSADSAKEEVKSLIKKVENRLELGMQQIEKANEKMEKIEEKAVKNEKKSEEKAKKLEGKEREKTAKKEEKAGEALKRSEEKARETALKAEEKARKAAEKAEDKLEKIKNRKAADKEEKN